MKPNFKTNHMVSAPVVAHYDRRARWLAVLSPYLKHLNMRTLALIMFVALAFLSTSHGKDAETREAALTGATKNAVVIAKQTDHVSNIVPEPARQTMSPAQTLWQFMTKILDAFEGALNDPSLIEYAKQQGIDIPASPTTPCSKTFSQSRTHNEPQDFGNKIARSR